MRCPALALAVMALFVAGCVDNRIGTGDGATVRAPGGQVLALPRQQGAPATAAAVPHVYMAIQPSGSGPVSVIFAIDEARDNSPENDPAMRLTPENGRCNPQQLARYNFPPEYGRRPVFSVEESRRGITAKDLPNFMAMMVTSEMMRLGLVVEPQDSKPQNVCTRKLWEQLIVEQSAGTG